MDLGITGRVALVAGGGRGVGREVAKALAREGCDVAVLSRTQGELDAVAAEVRALGRKALPLAVDALDLKALNAAVARVQAELGPPTILVLGIAAYWEPKKLQFLSDEEARKLLDGDLYGAVALCQRVLPDMMDARFGRIVALGSLAARAGIPGGALYATAKAGLEGLVRGIAVDYSRRGITANCLALGFLDTERFAQRVAGKPELRARLENVTAARKLVSPEEAAQVVAFLCSANASAVTGAVLEVTSGAHLPNFWG
jgi:NAD(P)-dependent dehydrogenase (short-subunit alcohol dehydrogenase family)